MESLALALLLAAAAAGAARADNPLRVLEVPLSGVAPAQVADVAGMGVAEIKVFANGADYALEFQITTTNLSQPLPPVAQHIHRGTAAQVGGIVVVIPGAWAARNGGAQWVLQGRIPNTGALRSANNATYTQVMNQVLADPAGFYVNVHTHKFPDGAVRGQVSGSPSAAFNVALRGVTPAQVADAGASGTLSLQVSNQNGQYRVQYSFSAFNLTRPLPPTAQHIHRGAATQTGPVVLPLPGTWSQHSQVLWAMQGEIQNADIAAVNQVLANPAGFYVNVHTLKFPDGAIRGQVLAGSR